MDTKSFWEDPEQVERFANREADHRLMEWLDRIPDPAAVRVLDIGCAGGRNTDVLAARGFDVFALDASEAMVRRTRQRVAASLGEREAQRRVRHGSMLDLSGFPAASFDLVVSLGVFHAAHDMAQWERALSEAERMLAPGGSLLVSVFGPETTWTGEPIQPVAGAPHVFEGMHSGRHVFVGPADLDAAMTRLHLQPVVPTVTVIVPIESGQRVTINALYRKKT